MAKKQLAFWGVVASSVAFMAGVALATPGSGTTGIVVARSAFTDRVDLLLSVKHDERGRESVQVRNSQDTVMQQIVFNAGGHSGWHSHPGPAVILIKAGELTFYQDEGGQCVSRTYSAGQALVDPGQGHEHLAVNTSAGTTEVWVTYFDVPAGASPRIDVPVAPAACAS